MDLQRVLLIRTMGMDLLCLRVTCLLLSYSQIHAHMLSIWPVRSPDCEIMDFWKNAIWISVNSLWEGDRSVESQCVREWSSWWMLLSRTSWIASFLFLFTYICNTLLPISSLFYCNTLTGSIAVSCTATYPRKLTVMWSKVSSGSCDLILDVQSDTPSGK